MGEASGDDVMWLDAPNVAQTADQVDCDPFTGKIVEQMQQIGACLSSVAGTATQAQGTARSARADLV